MRRQDLFIKSDQRSVHRKVLTHSSDAPETLARAPHHTNQQDAPQDQQRAQRRAHAHRRSSSQSIIQTHKPEHGQPIGQAVSTSTCVQPIALQTPDARARMLRKTAHLIASQAHKRRSTFWINSLAESVARCSWMNRPGCCARAALTTCCAAAPMSRRPVHISVCKPLIMHVLTLSTLISLIMSNCGATKKSRRNAGFLATVEPGRNPRWHWANPPPGQSWRWVPPTGRNPKWKYSA